MISRLVGVAGLVVTAASGRVEANLETDGSARTQSLDGSDWRIATDPQGVGRDEHWWAEPRPEAKPIRVPSIVQEAFPGHHGGAAWYWRDFVAPAHPHPSGRYLLKFWSVDYLADVWLNQVHVGAHEGADQVFVLDVTEAIRPNMENRLAVRVFNPLARASQEGPALNATPHSIKGCFDFWNSSGIVGSVELLLVPPVWIEDVFVWLNPYTGKVRIQATVRNALSQAVTGKIQVSIAPAPSSRALDATRIERKLKPGDTPIEAQLEVKRPRLWNLNDPFLHRVMLRVWAEHGNGYDEQSVNCGFRDFRVVNGYFFLNGKRLFVKSAHSVNHTPVSQVLPPPQAPDIQRNELLYAKACGFNMVRFLAMPATPRQLDLCDEIGLLVYQGHRGAWFAMDNVPEMATRFDHSLAGVIRRDRNRACVVMWELLNECARQTLYEFTHAVEALKVVRAWDDTRVVLLNSGRFDQELTIGSLSNPGSDRWEHQWGAERPDADPAVGDGCGDIHAYHAPPLSRPMRQLIREKFGSYGKPVFVSEGGVAGLSNVILERRHYEQFNADWAAEAQVFRTGAELLTTEWARYRMDKVYAFPEDMLLESQRLNCRQRLYWFDLIRSNPMICGYSITDLLDGTPGEGFWTMWREWRLGVGDVLRDGWAPLRWCVFVEPTHIYSGETIRLEVVLANEDVLQPGEYPATLRIAGPTGIAWEKKMTVRIPSPMPGGLGPLAVPVSLDEVKIETPGGPYQVAVNLERGGHPAGGRLTLYVSEKFSPSNATTQVTTWGIDERIQKWLASHGLKSRRLDEAKPEGREILLIGNVSLKSDSISWRELMTRVARGGVALFLSPECFKRGDDELGWLPLKQKGKCNLSEDGLYRSEVIAQSHPIFAGLQAKGIMDWEYYGPIISRHRLLFGQPIPDDVAAASYWVGNGAIKAGFVLGMYKFNEGAFLLNTLPILDNLDKHPAADRLLLNMINYASTITSPPLAPPPADLNEELNALGYVSSRSETLDPDNSQQTIKTRTN